MFDILGFAREYELIALNAGINFQKGKQNVYLSSVIEQQKALINELKAENERLATILEQHINPED